MNFFIFAIWYLFGTGNHGKKDPIQPTQIEHQNVTQIHELEELRFIEENDINYFDDYVAPKKVCLFILSNNSTRTNYFFKRNFRKNYQWNYYSKVISIYSANDHVDEEKDILWISHKLQERLEIVRLKQNVTHDHLYTKVLKAMSIPECEFFVKVDDDIWLNHSLFHYLLNEMFVTLNLENVMFGGFWHNNRSAVRLVPTGSLYGLDKSLFSKMKPADSRQTVVFDEIEIATQLFGFPNLVHYNKFEYFYGKGYRHHWQRGCRWLVFHHVNDQQYNHHDAWTVCKQIGTIPI